MADTAPAHEATNERRQVLIVGADAEGADELERLLTSEGYVVDVVDGVAAADDALPRLAPQLVLIDLRVGAGDEVDLIDRLASRRPAPGSIVVARDCPADEVARALRRGAEDFVSMPIEPPLLAATVERCFERRKRDGERREAEEALRASRDALEHQLAERSEALQRAEQLFTDTIEALPDGLAIFGPDERLIRCNEKYHELHPLVRDVMVPGTSFEHILRAALERGQHVDSEGREEEWVEARFKAFRNPGAAIEQEFPDRQWRRVYERKLANGGTVAVRTDISRLKRRELRLGEMERRQSDYLDASSDWYWEMDEHCRFSYFSDRFEEVTGVPTSALLGKTREETGIPGVDPDTWNRHLENLALRRSFRDFRHPRDLPDGRTVTLSINGKAIFDQTGQFRGYRGTGRDISDLIAFERKARSAETTLRSAVGGLTELFVLWDADDRLVLCNDVFREINADIIEFTRPGTSLEAHLRAGLDIGIYLEAVGREEEWLVERIHLHHHPGKPFETRRQDGRWLLINGQKMPDGTSVTIGIDITERKLAEEALRGARDELEERVRRRTLELQGANENLGQSEKRLQDFASASADWFWEMDSDLRFTYMSPNVERIVGVPPEWHYGKTREGLLGENYDREVWEAHLATLRRREPFRDFIYYRDGEGIEARWLSASGLPVYDAEGNFQGYRGTGRDVTELKLIEEALRERQNLLDAVVENLPVALSLKDRDGRFTLVNPGFERLHDVTAADVLGRTFFDILPHEVAADAAAEDRLVLDRGEPLRTDYSWPDHLGVERDEIIIKFPLHSRDHGPTTGVGVIALDVTDRRRLEDQLKQAQKMEALGQLTGGVAHDFNNLLAVIQGNAELLPDMDGQETQKVQAILRASGRGAELTQRLLAFSRQQPLKPQPIILSNLVAGMTSLLKRTLGETIEVRTVIAPGLWPALADPGQVENALLNLVINARDAMSGQGRLAIECANIHLEETDLSNETETIPGDYAVLSVTDNGAGMAPEVRAQAFEPFFTTKEVGEGSGLGLSMVYGFARQSGGHASIYSEEGRGTTVKLYLPRTMDDVARDDTKPEPEVARGRGERILVIEDDEDVRALVVRMLRGLGYHVAAAAAVAQARDAMAEGPAPDLLLTDVVLPGGIGGPEFAAEIRARHPDIAIVFMSGYPADAARGEGLLDSEYVLLNKPFERRVLAEMLRQALKHGADG